MKNIFDLLIETKLLGTILELNKCVNHCHFCENKTKLRNTHPEYQKKYFFHNKCTERFGDLSR